MTAKSYRYTVQGAWPFPTDMLRYDNSHAASLHDEEVVDGLSGEVCGLDGEVRIRLTGDQMPNIARWESCGWKVVDGDANVRLRMLEEQAIKRDKAATADEIDMGRLDHDPSRAEACDAAA
jgi:hypothetical protein